MVKMICYMYLRRLEFCFSKNSHSVFNLFLNFNCFRSVPLRRLCVPSALYFTFWLCTYSLENKTVKRILCESSASFAVRCHCASASSLSHWDNAVSKSSQENRRNIQQRLYVYQSSCCLFRCLIQGHPQIILVLLRQI